MAIIIQKSLPNHRGSYIYGHPRGSNSGFFSINVVNMTITRQFVRLTHIKGLKHIWLQVWSLLVKILTKPHGVTIYMVTPGGQIVDVLV